MANMRALQNKASFLWIAGIHIARLIRILLSWPVTPQSFLCSSSFSFSRMAQNAEEIKAIRDLKPLLISDAQAAYGPDGYARFDITTSSRINTFDGKSLPRFVAQVIGYTSMRLFASWTLLSKGEESNSILGAYLSLWNRVQADMGLIVDNMKTGGVYKGK